MLIAATAIPVFAKIGQRPCETLSDQHRRGSSPCSGVVAEQQPATNPADKAPLGTVGESAGEPGPPQ